MNENPLLNYPEKINNYRIGLSLIVKRLLWDLNPRSFGNVAKISKLKNTYKGKKVVILCNGPSLLKTDFELLNQEGVYTIGLNKINLLDEKFNFKPTFIAAVNSMVLEQNAEYFNSTDLPLFVDSKGAKNIKKRKNVHFLHAINQRFFSRDISQSINQGHTVTYVAMQLAFHLGFQEVTLVGCDHYFSAMSKGKEDQVVTTEDKDHDHFDPNYFGKGVKWELPNLFESEVSYTMAKKHFEAFGRKIYNSTEGGHLDIYPRIPLKDFLNK